MLYGLVKLLVKTYKKINELLIKGNFNLEKEIV